MQHMPCLGRASRATQPRKARRCGPRPPVGGDRSVLCGPAPGAPRRERVVWMLSTGRAGRAGAGLAEPPWREQGGHVPRGERPALLPPRRPCAAPSLPGDTRPGGRGRKMAEGRRDRDSEREREHGGVAWAAMPHGMWQPCRPAPGLLGGLPAPCTLPVQVTGLFRIRRCSQQGNCRQTRHEATQSDVQSAGSLTPTKHAVINFGCPPRIHSY